MWAVERVDSVDGIEFYVIKSGTREIYYRKSDLALSLETLPEGVDRRHTPANAPAWPLVPGKSWTWHYTLERPLQRMTSEEVRFCVVEKEERITVPAGTFDTLKVVCSDPRTQQVTHEIWLSPDVRQRVKDRFRVIGGYEVRELIRYHAD